MILVFLNVYKVIFYNILKFKCVNLFDKLNLIWVYLFEGWKELVSILFIKVLKSFVFLVCLLRGLIVFVLYSMFVS